MFKDFNISSFKKTKPPSDNSFDTNQEIKALKKIPLRKEFVKKYDDIVIHVPRSKKGKMTENPTSSIDSNIPSLLYHWYFHLR